MIQQLEVIEVVDEAQSFLGGDIQGFLQGLQRGALIGIRIDDVEPMRTRDNSAQRGVVDVFTRRAAVSSSTS